MGEPGSRRKTPDGDSPTRGPLPQPFPSLSPGPRSPPGSARPHGGPWRGAGGRSVLPPAPPPPGVEGPEPERGRSADRPERAGRSPRRLGAAGGPGGRAGAAWLRPRRPLLAPRSRRGPGVGDDTARHGTTRLSCDVLGRAGQEPGTAAPTAPDSRGRARASVPSPRSGRGRRGRGGRSPLLSRTRRQVPAGPKARRRRSGSSDLPPHLTCKLLTFPFLCTTCILPFPVADFFLSN